MYLNQREKRIRYNGIHAEMQLAHDDLCWSKSVEAAKDDAVFVFCFQPPLIWRQFEAVFSGLMIKRWLKSDGI